MSRFNTEEINQSSLDQSRANALRLRELKLLNKAVRALWKLIWLLLFRPSPTPLHAWRRFILRCFGAKVGRGAHPYPSARIWAPWNLEMGDYSCLSEGVDCYCVDVVRIGSYSTVSQYSFLCTASHDYSQTSMPLMSAPINIGERVWITADVFVAPGVTIGDGAVVLSRSSVFTNLPPWMVSKGNPAVPIKPRRLDGHQDAV